MKKLFILLAIVAVSFSTSYGQGTSAKSDNNPATIYAQPETNAGRQGGCEFLVFRDNLPWSFSSVTDILSGNGESYTVLNSSAMATEDFSLYDVIIIESDQVPGFHTNFQASFAKFVTFVQNGGRLEVHAATCGHNSPCGYSVVLPGGVFTTEQYDNYNVIINAAHPIVAGVADPFYGNYASHGYFSNLYPGTDIITAAQSNNEPTTIQYTFGSGTVTATTCTYEWGYVYGQGAGTMLVNNLEYSCDFVSTPVSPWAIGLGIFLILAFTVFRIRRS
jgi:hypothetical protein